MARRESRGVRSWREEKGAGARIGDIRRVVPSGTAGRMSLCPSPIQRKFREDVVAVARCQEDGVTIKQMATDFGISETCLQNWLRQADVDIGRG